MAAILAIISKAIFERDAPGADVGDVLPIDRYASNPAAFAPLAEGGTLYIVTVRPGDVLWLVAKLDQPKLARGEWVATPNTTPITDLSRIVAKLRFASGNGLKAKPGQLGMSLQTPRALADADVALITGLAGAKPARTSAVISPKLEQALAGGEDDAFLVYGDALQQQGDPRGELIHVQHRLARKPADKQLVAAEAALFAKHPDLLGPLAAIKKHLSWRLGFVDRARLDHLAADQLRELLAHPSASRIRELDVDAGYDAGPATVLALASTPKPSLRALTLRQGYMGDGDDDEGDGDEAPARKKPKIESYRIDGGHGHKAGDRLWAAMPGLERLHVMGWGLFHDLALPALRELAIEGYPFCTEGAWKLPKLEVLAWTLDVDDTDTGVDFETSFVAHLWTSKLPGLRRLDLSSCLVGMTPELFDDDGDDDDGDDDEDDDEFGVLVQDSGFHRLVKQLDTLWLSDHHVGTGDDLVRTLTSRTKVFAHLRELGVRGKDNPKVTARVRAELPNFRFVGAKEALSSASA